MSKYILKYLYKILDTTDIYLNQSKYTKYKKFYRDSSPRENMLGKLIEGKKFTLSKKINNYIEKKSFSILNSFRTFVVKIIFKFEKSEYQYIITDEFKNSEGKKIKVGVKKELRPQESYLIRQRYKK